MAQLEMSEKNSNNSDSEEKRKKKKKDKKKKQRLDDDEDEHLKSATDNQDDIETPKKVKKKKKRSHKETEDSISGEKDTDPSPVKKMKKCEKDVGSKEQADENPEDEKRKKKKAKKKKHQDNETYSEPLKDAEEIAPSTENVEQDVSNKTESDQSSEGKPKKRKKKKQLKPDEDKDSKPDICQVSLNYLNQWVNNRSNWHFQKVRQVWLLQHMYDGDKLNDDYFKMMLDYMVEMKGKARELTIQQAEKMIDEDKPSETDDIQKFEEKCERAKQVLQMMS